MRCVCAVCCVVCQQKGFNMQQPQDIRGVSGGSPAQPSPLRQLLLYSFLLFTIPIFLYFFMKHIVLEDIFKVSEHTATLCSAVVAIGAVHVILGLFVYSAYKEEARPKPSPVKTD